MKVLKNIFVLLFLSGFVLLSCENELPVLETDQGSQEAVVADSLRSVNLQSSTCGGTYSGSFSTINSYHAYPYRTIDVSCAAMGATISISVVAYDIPNRFLLKDTNGNIVKQKNSTNNVDSGWIGTANYPGSWGSSLSTNNSFTYSFVKTQQTYRLYVETQTPPNGSYSPTADNWSATVGCQCASCPTTCTNCNTVVCPPPCTTPNDCTKLFTGNYNVINSFYSYPVRDLKVSCVATGATIQLNVSALDIPNKFEVKDSNGVTVATSGTSSNPSGWMGYANYPGQWGTSLSQTNTLTLTWTKSASISTYKLYVQTQTPPNATYNPTYDAWQATLGCSPKNN